MPRSALTLFPWSDYRWEGGPHDGERGRILEDGRPWSEWRACACHGINYRYVGLIDGVHVLAVALLDQGLERVIELDAGAFGVADA